MPPIVTIDKPFPLSERPAMPIALDDRDIRILAVLSREGRLSKAELARRVNLSATPCWERLNRMEKAGIIEGYHAGIALKRIAPHVVVFVMAELERHQSGTFDTFERRVLACEEVTGCWALGGGFDYLLQVTTRDIDSYQRLIDSLLEARIGLARYYTYIVTKPLRSGGPPPLDLLLGGS